ASCSSTRAPSSGECNDSYHLRKPGSPASHASWSGLARGRDLARIRGRWHYIYRAIDGHGQIVDAYVSPTRDLAAARRFFEWAIACSGTTPRRVITDKAATYPPALAAAVPGVLHRTGRYRTNAIERHHGILKERLRPKRGLQSVASAAGFMRGQVVMPCATF